MKRLFPIALGALLALSSAASAAVRVGIKDGKRFLYNDGASSAPRESIHESDTSGRDTINALKAGLRLATSERTATMMPDKAHLRIK